MRPISPVIEPKPLPSPFAPLPQVQKCTAEANAAATQERSVKGGPAAVGGGSASALLLGVGRAATAGLVLALAGVKRECDRSALAAWTTGGVAQVRTCAFHCDVGELH